MAKTQIAAKSPADIVRERIEAEKARPSNQAIIEAAKLDTRTPEERAADEPNTVDVDEADLDAADLLADMSEGSAFANVDKAEFDLSEGPAPSEDPELVAARKAQFDRAAEFEKKREETRARKAAMLAGVPTAQAIPDSHIGVAGDIPEVFYRYATALPPTTPDEHIMCGYGSIKLTVGDFRRLVGLPTRT